MLPAGMVMRVVVGWSGGKLKVTWEELGRLRVNEEWEVKSVRVGIEEVGRKSKGSDEMS